MDFIKVFATSVTILQLYDACIIHINIFVRETQAHITLISSYHVKNA